MTAVFVPAGNNEAEPNNTRETAQVITSGQTVTGFISYQDANDFYKVVLTQASRVTLTIPYDADGPSYLLINWLDADGGQIRTNSHYFSPYVPMAYNHYEDLEAGTYYIEIAKTALIPDSII